ncbi:MAG: L-histidine N(alpha)-methyltransferase [Myxococcales bacterium]|nr:L-histidine N(alpha)-methyltransferase [Myxococcales bacterium]
MAAPPVAIRARVESDPDQKTEREEILPRATVWVDDLTDDPQAFALSVARGLSTQPPQLDCRYLYDEVGSELFSEITRQPEYYPTRTEAQILARHAGELAETLGTVPICELGSGTAAKTRLLLDAWADAAQCDFHYVPVDIDPGVVRSAATTLAEQHPDLHVSGLATSYENALERVRDISPKLVLFLGSTLGNFEPAEMDKFMRMIEGALRPGDAFLLGVDLVKDRETLEAAYNDAAGVTERFTLNLFERMNRELDAGIPEKAVEHVAFWNDRDDQIEIYGRFREDVQIDLPGLEQRFEMTAGQMVRVEISRKFRIDRLRTDLARYRLRMDRVFTDDQDHFALLLLRRVDSPDEARSAA